MNTALEDISDIFAILHDGEITSWTGDLHSMTLKVACTYLAERINPHYDYFIVELKEVDKLELEPWMNPMTLPQLYYTQPKEIFQASLEILASDLLEGYVRITCNQHNTDFDYCGGNLLLSAKACRVLDQSGKLLTIDEFDQLCKGYWNDLGRVTHGE